MIEALQTKGKNPCIDEFDWGAKMISNYYSGNFEALMAETYPRIFKFALKLARNEEVARDLCQETYIRAYRNQAERTQNGDPMPWFFKIAYNCFLDHLRLQSRRPKAVSFDSFPSTDYEREFVDPTENPEQLLMRDQICPEILSAMKGLSQAKQDLIRLSLIEGLPYEEIAEMYSCSVPAIRTRVHRAVNACRRRIVTKEPKFSTSEEHRIDVNSLAA